jgi:sterol desaturase/sphingolipid hydroxylase (fatty acid hydroxylase superfamily)
MRALFRLSFYPVFVVSALLGHLALIRAFPGFHPTLWASVVLMPAVGVVMALEYIVPYRKSWNQMDGEFWLDFVLTNLMFPVVVEGIAFSLKFAFGEGLGSFWPKDANIFVQLALALVIAEFFFYWIHRLGHERESMWRFHKIHHSAKRVYWMNAARFHPIDIGLNFVFYFLPLALLGAHDEIFALVFIMNAATGLLEHGNIDFDAGVLNRVFNTAQLHRWHHSVDEKISQRNYGKVLSVWDQVFGTYYLPKRSEVDGVGVIEGGQDLRHAKLSDLFIASS